MPDCCDPTPYRRFFNRKEADRNVRSYRKRGLDPMATDAGFVVRHTDNNFIWQALVLERVS